MRKIKRFAATALSLCMVASIMSGCGGAAPATGGDTGAATDTAAPAADAGTKTDAPAASDSGSSAGTINVWAFTDEVPGMIEKFKETHPDFAYDINPVIIATTEGA